MSARVTRPAWDSGRWRAAFFVIVGFAVIVRVALVIGTAGSYEAGFDSGDFDRIGVSIARTGDQPPATDPVPGGGPSAFRPPALSYMLGATYRLAGADDESRRWTAARLVQAVLGGLAAGAAGLLALALAGRVAALIAAAVVAVDPTLIMLSLSLLTEPLFLLVMLLAAAAVVRYRADPRLRWAVCAGLLGGVAALTRSNGLILVLVLAAAVLLTGRRPVDVRAALLVLACAALVVAPWTVRNAVVLDAFVPVTTASGYTAAGLYQPAARERRAQWRVPVQSLLEFRRDHPRGTDLQLSRALGDDAKAFLAEHPAYLVEVGFWNTLRLVDAYQPDADRKLLEAEGIHPDVAAPGVYAAWVLLPLLTLGLLLGGRGSLPWFLWLAAVLLAASAIFLGGGNARYRAPVEVLLITGAAAGYARRLTRRMGAAGVEPARR